MRFTIGSTSKELSLAGSSGGRKRRKGRDGESLVNCVQGRRGEGKRA